MVFIRVFVRGERVISNSTQESRINWRQQLIYGVELTCDNFDTRPRVKDVERTVGTLKAWWSGRTSSRMTRKSSENRWGCNESSGRREIEILKSPGQARTTILSRISRAGFARWWIRVFFNLDQKPRITLQIIFRIKSDIRESRMNYCRIILRYCNRQCNICNICRTYAMIMIITCQKVKYCYRNCFIEIFAIHLVLWCLHKVPVQFLNLHLLLRIKLLWLY